MPSDKPEPKEPTTKDASRTDLYVKIAVVALIVIVFVLLVAKSGRAKSASSKSGLSAEDGKFDMRAEVAKLNELQLAR